MAAQVQVGDAVQVLKGVQNGERYCAGTIETLVEGRADCDRQHYRSGGGGVHVFAP